MKLKRVLVSLLFVGIFATSVAFSANEKSPRNTPQTEYTEDNPNIVITADHPEFTLKLKSNATTGYAWYLREYDSNLLVPVKHHFEVSKTHKLMGAPGYEWWTFRVKPIGFTVPQQTTIRMIYARPWQGNDNVTQVVFRVTTVRE